MKTLMTTVILFVSLLVIGQKGDCYCYENPETNYIERLFFWNDSVFVIGQKDKTCKDSFDFESALNSMREKGMVWAVSKTENEVSFTKIISSVTKVNGELMFYSIEYRYSGSIKKKKLDVHIEYSNSFIDYMGPPDRVYNKIKEETK